MEKKNLIEGEYDGAPLPNEVLYELMFADLTEQEQIDFKGKPLTWNNGLVIFPDGTVKNEKDL